MTTRGINFLRSLYSPSEGLHHVTMTPARSPAKPSQANFAPGLSPRRCQARRAEYISDREHTAPAGVYRVIGPSGRLLCENSYLLR